jgi:predicted HD superfamily hydrolase involved in NAD metabolism
VELYRAWNGDSADIEILSQAALLHDVAKEMDGEAMRQAIAEGWIVFGNDLLETRGLVHAPLSAAYAERRFGLRDREALFAIAYHPTGHPDFGDLGLAIFLADYLEPNRTFENHREVLLALAYKDPVRAALEVARQKIDIMKRKNRSPHPVSIAFHDYLQQHLEPERTAGKMPL